MELTSSGTHGTGGLEAVQGFIQDYQLLVQAQYYPNAHAHTLLLCACALTSDKIGKLLHNIQYLSIFS